MMRKLVAGCATALILVCTAANSRGQMKEPDFGAITTPAQALSVAKVFTGFDRTEYLSKSTPEEMAVKVSVTDNQTPYFSERINNRELWRVTFDSVFLSLPDLVESVEANQVRKTYDVFLDPESGELLKVVSRFEGRDPNLSDEPPAERATNDMKANGVVYEGLVGKAPEVDLYRALQAAPFCYPVQSKQIIAVLVLSSYNSDAPRPVWSILGRGTPPLRMTGLGAHLPDWTANRILGLIDATTGAVIVGMGGIPRADPPKSSEDQE